MVWSLIDETNAAMAAHVGHSPIRRQADRLIQECEEALAKAGEASKAVARGNGNRNIADC